MNPTNDMPFNRRAGLYYVGSFDDEILRHNDDGFNRDAINETLSQAALFGGPLLINDGQLLLTKDGQDALLDASISPLLDLMEAGYVKLYSRNGDPKKLPQLMAPTVHTYQRVLDNPRWPEIYDQLARLQDEIGLEKMLIRWPKLNTGPGFQRIINMALEHLKTTRVKGTLTLDQLDRLQGEFNNVMDAHPNAPGRTKFREACESEKLKLGPDAIDQLHWVGLEAYHYNMAMAASQSDPDRAVGLITRYSHLFPDFRDPALKPHSGGALLEEIPRPALPRHIPPRALHDGKLLREVVSPTSTLNALKRKYLNAVDRAIADRNLLPAVQSAANAYGNEIASYIDIHSPQKTNILLEAVKIVASAFATVQLAHSGMGDGLWAHAGGKAAEKSVEAGAKAGMVWAAKRFATSSGLYTSPLAVDMLDPLEDYSDEVGYLNPGEQGVQWFAFLGINQNAVQAHVKTMPEYKG